MYCNFWHLFGWLEKFFNIQIWIKIKFRRPPHVTNQRGTHETIRVNHPPLCYRPRSLPHAGALSERFFNISYVLWPCWKPGHLGKIGHLAGFRIKIMAMWCRNHVSRENYGTRTWMNARIRLDEAKSSDFKPSQSMIWFRNDSKFRLTWIEKEALQLRYTHINEWICHYFCSWYPCCLQ